MCTDDLTGLDHHDIYLRLAVNGRTSAPFSGRTLCHPTPAAPYSAEIIQRSRERYTRRREVVERGAERHYLASRGVPCDPVSASKRDPDHARATERGY